MTHFESCSYRDDVFSSSHIFVSDICYFGYGCSLQVIQSIAERCAKHGESMFEVSLVALDRHGTPGASSTFNEWRDHVTGAVYEGTSFLEDCSGY